MIKYLKYYLSSLFLILGIYICTLGGYYPTFFFISFSLIIIIGDIVLGEDLSFKKYSYPQLINLPMYLNFFLLLLFLLITISILGSSNPNWFSNFLYQYLYIDLVNINNSITLIDKISLIAITSLYIGIMGTVPGHELTHRKREKLDMFFGNWLLSLSWDCTFAIEHVYGHHKNVCLPIDPATAKRGESIYLFVVRATIREHIDAWKIELSRLKRRSEYKFGLKNKMILGYTRSLSITLLSYIVGGLAGMFTYLLCAFIAKSLLEVINYTEHYGLVRELDKPVHPRHSWNSNSILSSILLYNVTRHSAHHEKSNLKFWELDTYTDAPMMPYGYLSMLYLAIFLPFTYHRIMAKKLIEWDLNYATPEERKIAALANRTSGISLLAKY